jgi:catechol 2,3-dioxygenase-like lactoylglutathione lyase family enzyme
MKFEHFALNVPDARAMSRWYVDHVGFKIVRRREEPPYTHFLSDETGRIVVELYTNLTQAFLDFAATHPLLFHFAVVATDARSDRQRLEKAGASLLTEEVLPDGSVLVMLRDPWGVPLQLCQRTTPFPGY